jgi:salicylate hydroxylase
MARFPVVIAGAGIAGLTAAIALARQGLDVTVLEKGTGFAETGAGLQLSPNASRVLIGLGLTAITRHVVSPEQLDIRRWDQPRAFASMPMGTQARYEAPFWLALRTDLQTSLLDRARAMPNIALMVDRAVTGLLDHGDHLEIAVTRGNGQTETLPASFLVGADGLWSSVRAVAGQASAPQFTGYEAWRTLIRSEAAPAFMRQPRVALWMGPDRHGVHYPVDAGRQINLVIIRRARTAPPGSLPGSDDAWNLAPDDAQTSQLAEGAAVPLKHLISAAPSWRRWPLYDNAPARMAGGKMAAGKLALIGDAAHPVLPFLAQGAALGIEDAAELAAAVAPALLAGDNAALLAATEAFDRSRRPRARRVQQTARNNGGSYHLGWPWSRARDLVIRNIGPEGLFKRHEWIYGWKGGA